MVILIVIASVCFFSRAWADPWAVVANLGSTVDPVYPQSIHTIDLGVTPPAVHGPFLAGQFGDEGGYVLDVHIIPGQRAALISNFGGQTVYRVDLKNPINPVVTGSVLLDDSVDSMFAEDIAITADGRLAIVADGGFSSTIAFIDLETLTLNSLYTLPNDYEAQAVAIAPDNQTVIMADYLGSAILYGQINATRDGLVSLTAIAGNPLCDFNDDPVCPDGEELPRPINIAISPDGQTVLVANTFDGTANVLRITGPGTVEPGTPFLLQVLPTVDPEPEYGLRSIDFSPDGSRAYIASNGGDIQGVDVFDQLSWLQVTGPGAVAIGGVAVAELLSNSSGGFYGVDVLAVTPDGYHALVGNMTTGNSTENVSLVNLDTFAVTSIPTNSIYPVGIDIASFPPITVPLLTPWGMGAFVLLSGLGAICGLLRKKSSLKTT